MKRKPVGELTRAHLISHLVEVSCANLPELHEEPKSDSGPPTNLIEGASTSQPVGIVGQLKSQFLQVLSNLEAFDREEVELVKKQNAKLVGECARLQNELKAAQEERVEYKVRMAADYQNVVEEMELLKLRSERLQRKATLEANAKHEMGLWVASMECELEGWKSKLEGVLK